VYNKDDEKLVIDEIREEEIL